LWGSRCVPDRWVSAAVGPDRWCRLIQALRRCGTLRTSDVAARRWRRHDGPRPRRSGRTRTVSTASMPSISVMPPNPLGSRSCNVQARLDGGIGDLGDLGDRVRRASVRDGERGADHRRRRHSGCPARELRRLGVDRGRERLHGHRIDAQRRQAVFATATSDEPTESDERAQESRCRSMRVLDTCARPFGSTVQPRSG